MKRINLNIKDRKTLFLVLDLVIVSVFTLTVVYAALNTVLTIQGNARVSAANWDIYLNNPRVTNGSATTDVPEIKTSSTLEFSTTLNMPGDFYEFTVDVINGGSIDAMIENVIKNPELDASQKKYLNYTVSYQNGESITTKQTLSKGTTMPIKVRIEYRKDLVASDLPTGQVILDLSLTLEYVQSDGSGSSVNNNGAKVISANSDINAIGTIVTIGSEQFYTIGTAGDNVKLLSMYNLYVGGEHKAYVTTAYGDEATGMQDSTMLGKVSGLSGYKGKTLFASDEKKGTNYSDYNGSIVEEYVNSYKTALETEFVVDVVEARLITKAELTSDEIGCSDTDYTCTKSDYPWIYSTSYWSGSAYGLYGSWYVDADGHIGHDDVGREWCFGVRPVIVISKSYF